MSCWSEKVQKFNQFAFEFPMMEGETPYFDKALAELVANFQIDHSNMQLGDYSRVVEAFLEDYPEIEENKYFQNIEGCDPDGPGDPAEAKKAFDLLSWGIKGLISDIYDEMSSMPQTPVKAYRGPSIVDFPQPAY